MNSTEPKAYSQSRWLILALCLLAVALRVLAVYFIRHPFTGSDPAGNGIMTESAIRGSVYASYACIAAAILIWLFMRKKLPLWFGLLPIALALLSAFIIYSTINRDQQSGQIISKANNGTEYVEGKLVAGNRTEDRIISLFFKDYEQPYPEAHRNSLHPEYFGIEESDPHGGGSSQEAGRISLNRPKHLIWYIWKIGKRNADGSAWLKDEKTPVVVCEATLTPYISPLSFHIRHPQFPASPA